MLTMVKEANAITGGLSSPSKMPSRSISLDRSYCKTGQILSKIAGSVCSKCYAKKGHYQLAIGKVCRQKRLEAIKNPLWVEAMTLLIKKQSSECFRWHDSGDIQSIKHLEMIVQICNNTPETKHWLPTKEYQMVKTYLKKHGSFPKNLVIRIGMPMIGESYSNKVTIPNGKTFIFDDRVNFSAVMKKGQNVSGHVCNAVNTDHECKDCRKCWDKKVATVVYPYH